MNTKFVRIFNWYIVNLQGKALLFPEEDWQYINIYIYLYNIRYINIIQFIMTLWHCPQDRISFNLWRKLNFIPPYILYIFICMYTRLYINAELLGLSVACIMVMWHPGNCAIWHTVCHVTHCVSQPVYRVQWVILSELNGIKCYIKLSEISL